MKKNFIALLLLCLFVSCNDSPKKETFNYDEVLEYYIPEINVTLLLPDSFTKASIDEQKKLIRKSVEIPEEIKSHQYAVLDHIKNMQLDMDLFLDDSEEKNLMWILRKAPQIELNPNTGKLLGQLYMQEQKKNKLVLQKSELLENKLFYRRGYNYLKVKIKQELFNGERYLIHYLVSTKNHSLTITFLHVDDYNFDEYIKRIKVLE